MVGVQMKMTTKQTGRFSGGLDSCPMMDYMSGQPNGRILPVAISLMGTLVKVQTKENKLFEGVFRAFSPNFDDIALEVVHQVESGKEDELPRRSTVTDKMIFKIEDIVKIEGTPDLESVIKGGFATDAEISRANNGSIENARDLEPWEPDAGVDEDHFAPENNGPMSDGWAVEDMFAVNKERFSIKSDYDEKLYHTAELNIDPNSEIDQERARRADELAREIERNPASKRAADLENDDEERDIVVRSGSSSTNNSTATTPTSATASGANNRYIPPNKRLGGDRGGNRGGSRRGGGGGGAQFQPTMRNQGSGDVRGGPGRGPPRDYGDGGAHPLNANFYAQRPGNRFGQQQQHHHHTIVAQTSHERSPTGTGGPEWERVKGSKRQDVRENSGAAPFPLPPQIPGPAMNRPMTMIPPSRPNTDNSSHNGNRRNKQIEEELKKFGRDFQLSSNPPSGIPNVAQGSGIAGSPVVPAAASSSGQSSRMPPQSSPTQSQMPHPPMSVPPPQQQQPQQQRRSPDLKNQPGSNYVMGGHQTGPPPHHHPHHHPNQNQPKAPLQLSPGQAQPPSHPPPMMRQEVPPRMMTANESMYQQQQVQQPPHPSMSQPHPTPDYSNPPHVHQQPQRPNHPGMMPMQGGQAGNGGGPPKIQPIPSHVPQMQPMVINQPPPSTMAPPPPAQTPQQQQQPPHHQQHEQDQRSNDSNAEAISRKSKLNPEAAEFRPGQFRPASTAAAPAMVPVVPNPAMASYPIPVQSPPQTPMMPQNPMQPNVVYGNVSAGGPVPNQMVYVGSAQNAYSQQQQPPLSSAAPMTLQIVPNAPIYAVHTAQPPVMIRPRPAMGPPQPAVAAATGQPIMASPYQQGPYVLYNTAGVHPTTQAHPVMPAGAGFPQNPTYVVGANRMLTPQYVVPQASAGSEHAQQQFYAVSPMVQGGPGQYPQAASVQSAMHQSAPGPQYMQPQHNGNNNHSQTPPTSQQQQQPSQPTNQSPATGPPPPNAGNVSGAGSMNAAPVIPYPPSAPTPQSPQYPTAPGGGAYPAPGQYIFAVPPHYMAAAAGQQYQGGLPPGTLHIQNTAPGYGYPAQHFVPAEMAAAVAAQAAAHQHLSHGSAGMYPAVLRSSSVTPFIPGGPVVSAASGQGATSVSHQNSHS